MQHFRLSGGKQGSLLRKCSLCVVCATVHSTPGPGDAHRFWHLVCEEHTHTHTLTKIMMMIIMVMTTEMRVYVATKARSLNPWAARHVPDLLGHGAAPELPRNLGLRGTLTWNSGSRGSEAAPPGPARLTCDASPGDALHHGLHGGGCSDWDAPCGQTLRLRQWLLGRRPLPATPEELREDPFESCIPPTPATPIHQLAPPMSITLTCHLSII